MLLFSPYHCCRSQSVPPLCVCSFIPPTTVAGLSLSHPLVPLADYSGRLGEAIGAGPAAAPTLSSAATTQGAAGLKPSSDAERATFNCEGTVPIRLAVGCGDQAGTSCILAEGEGQETEGTAALTAAGTPVASTEAGAFQAAPLAPKLAAPPPLPPTHTSTPHSNTSSKDETCPPAHDPSVDHHHHYHHHHHHHHPPWQGPSSSFNSVHPGSNQFSFALPLLDPAPPPPPPPPPPPSPHTPPPRPPPRPPCQQPTLH